MRNIIIVAMLLAAASTAGWFSIQRDGDHMTIDINRAEIRGDTRQIIDKGREILDRQQQQQEQNSNSQSQAVPWQQGQPTAWGGGNQPVNQPQQDRGFNGPPPQYGNGYDPSQGQAYGPSQGQAYGPSQPYYNQPANAARQPAPYAPAPNYSR